MLTADDAELLKKLRIKVEPEGVRWSLSRRELHKLLDELFEIADRMSEQEKMEFREAVRKHLREQVKTKSLESARS